MNGVAEAVRGVNRAEVGTKGGNTMKLIDETHAAEMLGCSVSALRKWRTLGKGPAFCRMRRLVRYSESDLVAYVATNRVEPANAEVAR